MMKKLQTVSIIFVTLFFILSGNLQVFAQNDQQEEQQVELTKKQKKELSKQYEELMQKYNKLLDTYVEYGVYTEEKAEKKKEHIKKHHKMLEENGFIPKWDEHHKKKCHTHKEEE